MAMVTTIVRDTKIVRDALILGGEHALVCADVAAMLELSCLFMRIRKHDGCRSARLLRNDTP